MLINRTGRPVEFMCGGRVYRFEPGEKKILEGFVAYHALEQVNTGLEEYVEGMEDVSTVSDISSTSVNDYSKLSWKALVKEATMRGVYKVGMKKSDLVKILGSNE